MKKIKKCQLMMMPGSNLLQQQQHFENVESAVADNVTDDTIIIMLQYRVMNYSVI
jgi:hypothetical protein